MGEPTPQIAAVRGAQNGQLRIELLEFWQARAGFGGEAAVQRLAEVVCAVQNDGRLAGTSSVFAADVGLVAGWPFWLMRWLLAEGLEDSLSDLITATFNTLDAEHVTDRGEPVGLCVLLDEGQRQHLPPEAEWADPRMIYAGYLPDGRQARVAYFTDEVSSMDVPEPPGGWTPGPGYRIEPYAEQDTVGAEEVVALWTAEAGLTATEARRRLGELLLVGIAPDGSLAGLCTAYLSFNEQLRGQFWYYRTFVPTAHRLSHMAVSLIVGARERLVSRFVSGEDRRGLGIIFELENEGLKRRFPKGIWYESDFLFIGHNPHGAHVLVHYFPGVPAPRPDAQGSTYV